jgi:hypothetical protein
LVLEVNGHRIEPDRSVLACQVVASDLADQLCHRFRCAGAMPDTVFPELAHEAFGWRRRR